MSSRPIDEKIAKLSLDSAQFEKNASNAIKTFGDMNKAFSKSSTVDLSSLERSVDSISGRFTLLGNIGQAAFQRIANTALNLASQINSIFGIGGAIAGMQEYELKLNSIQTIMVNTGESIDVVSAALNELNEYADKTIYSFSDMTRNIGLFTAAGVDLQTSVSSIKGLANLAAGMGVSNEQAARATWQLSQALSSGYVKYQDWISVNNAGLGGTYFQEALVETANDLGTIDLTLDEIIKKYGGFGNSLTEGLWLTDEVLAATLDKFANDETLTKAATEYKSLSQIIDTMKEISGTGWADTWELLFGNIEEAKKFWTPIGEEITGFIDKSNNARNEFISQWKNLGGLESTFNGIYNIFKGLGNVLKPVREGFSKLFSGLTPQKLADISKGFEDITAKFANADFSTFSSVVTGAFSVVSSVVSGAIGLFTDFSGVLGKVKNVVIEVASFIGDKLGQALNFVGEHLTFGNIFAGLAGGGIFMAAKKIADVFNTIKEAIDNFTGGGSEKVDSIKESVTGLLDEVGNSLQTFTAGIKAGTLLTIASAVGILTLSISKLSTIKGGAVAASLGAIGIMLAELAGAFTLIQLSLRKLDTKGIIKAGVTLMTIAGAVYILAGAVETMASVDPERIGQGLLAVGIGLGELVIALKVLDGSKVSLSTSVAILAVAQSSKMLADAVEAFSGMNWDELKRGLTGMGIALAEVVAAVGVLGKVGGFSSLLGGGAILLAVQGLDEIAQALKDIGALDWETIKRGLTGMGIALAEIGIVVAAVGKISGFSSLFAGGAILMVVQGLSDITKALTDIGALDWETIKRGLAGMGGALGEIGIVTGALGKLAGFSGLLGAGTILIAVQSLKPIADALMQVGSMSWEEIGIGLAGLGGALVELGVVSGLLGSLSGISGLLGAGTLLLAVQSLKPIADTLSQIGSLSWEQIKIGLVGMGGALTELAVVSGLTGSLTGLAGLVGAGTITLASQGLGQLADAFMKFGSMDWDSIGQGLAAMGGAMAETALGGLLNTFSGLGAGAIAEMAPALGTLADSLKKWKDVTVPEGLSSQLGQVADGVMKFTFGDLGAGTISQIAKPMGTLATSISKWKDVTIPKNIGTDLGKLADGVKAFTLGRWGADTLNSVAKPIGTLATSLKKWDGVNVPSNIKQILTGLADGVKSFTTAFAGGWSLDSVIGPLGNLAGAIKKWNGVVIPEGLGTQLKQLAIGVKKFSGIDKEGFGSLENLAPAIQQISAAAVGLAGIDFSGAVNTITTFVNSLNVIPGQVQALGTSMVAAASAAVTSFSATFSAGIGVAAIVSIAGLTSMFASMNSIVISQGASLSMQFLQAGSNWMKQLISGINLGKPSVVSAVRDVMSSAADSVDGYYDDFYSAGSYAMDGLAAGISAGGSRAISNVASVARKALQAAKNELDINSPSKKFEEVGMYSDEGLAQGFTKYASVAFKAVRNVASTALNTMQSKLSNQSMDIQPRIVPIVDSAQMESLNDFQSSIDFTTLLKDKLGQNGSDKDFKLIQLLQAYNNKMDQFMDKLEDIKLYLHINGFEVDGETLTDVVDEVHTIRDLLDKTGKGE